MTDPDATDGKATAEGQATGAGTRKRNPEESRRRILDAAELAFARRGFDGARLRDIAQQAGVHHALVHHYYSDKRGLFRAVLRRGLGSMAGLGLTQPDLRQGLEHAVESVIGRLFDFLSDNRDLLRIIEGAFRDRRSASYEVTTSVLGLATQPLWQQLIAALAEGQGRGLVRKDLPPETVLLYGFSLVVYPFIMGSGVSSALGIPPYASADPERDRAHLVALMTQALRPV